MIGMEVPHVKEFAERLREVQKQRKWTQREMAGHIGITATSLSAYMNDRKTPALDVAVKIARALDVSIGWLCGEEEADVQLVTYGDIFRTLVALVDAPNTLFTLHRNATPGGSTVFIQTGNSRLYTFIKGFEHVHAMYSDRTIDREMYDAWLEKRFRDAADIPLCSASDDESKKNQPET